MTSGHAGQAEVDLEETYELRAVLEGLGARRAALRRDDATLAELAALADRMVDADPSLGHRPAGDFADLAALNARFHALIVQASGSAQRSHVLAARAVLMESHLQQTTDGAGEVAPGPAELGAAS